VLVDLKIGKLVKKSKKVWVIGTQEKNKGLGAEIWDRKKKLSKGWKGG